MQDYQQQFIKFCLEYEVLRFGEFTLKSGRKSPYFFNVGLLNTGAALAQLGEFYAKAIENAALDYDMLFGPAYKGISIAVSTAIAFAHQFKKDIPYAFNRKEVKDHGEGGNIVGKSLQGNRVIIIDDVITAGTAIREAMQILQQHDAKPVGIVVAMDRQERGLAKTSAIQEVSSTYHIPVISIIKLENLIEYLQTSTSHQQYLEALYSYRKQYGV